MVTNSINAMLFAPLSRKAELGLILFFFLFPALWGAVLAAIAVFEDLKRAFRKGKAG